MKQEYLKSSDLMKYFDVTYAAISKWVKNGKLPAYETIGGHYRFRKEDVIEFFKIKNLPIPKFETSEETHKVLIIDDENGVRLAIIEMLRDIENIEIETAKNGIEAGMKLIQFKPKLLILDALMPGANGDMVCELIRTNEKLKDIKILVFTGHPEEGKKLMDLGAHKLIIKGSNEFNIDMFRREVCKLLGIEVLPVDVK
jgi:excisionase family DNA binding protein